MNQTKAEDEILESIAQLSAEDRKNILSKENPWEVNQKDIGEWDNFSIPHRPIESKKRQSEKQQMFKDGFDNRKAWKKWKAKRALTHE